MILFIHGLNSSQNCQKCLLLQAKSDNTIIPSLDLLDIDESLKTLLFSLKKVDIIIGASFGGFYAHYLAKKYHKKLLLINPVLNPLSMIDRVDLEGRDRDLLESELEKIIRFNQDNAFMREIEVLYGLQDQIVKPEESRDFFSAYSCKFYADDHRLIRGFGSYLLHKDTLLSKYL